MTRSTVRSESWILLILIATAGCGHRTASSDARREESRERVAEARTVDPVESDEMIVRLYDVKDIVAPSPRLPESPCELMIEQSSPR